MLSNAAQWLADTLKATEGVSITYTRGAASATITAVQGRTAGEHLDTDGIVHKYESHDWLIAASDLVLSGSSATPARGDVIAYGGRTYQVEPIPGQDVFAYTDEHRTAMRIHTKQKV